MIKEAHEGNIDVIISMTSSRLFRYYEQAIQLQELLKQQQVNIITLDNDINTFEGNNKLINKSLWMVN
ncbi:recombinase family protein [Oceanobacillus caeni]|uniref:recombinase family protein n=1 Tax=Oceanobacillus caeni TaxID=405946 RepID=UPI001C2278DB|nr:recombinase family protein [Oceanobacillus caeni]